MHIDENTTPDQEDDAKVVWLCACGAGSRDPAPNEREAKKGWRSHVRTGACPLGTSITDVEGVTVPLTDPRWQAAWAKGRMLKEGGYAATRGHDLEDDEARRMPRVIPTEDTADA